MVLTVPNLNPKNSEPVPSIKKFGSATLLFRTVLYYDVSASIYGVAGSESKSKNVTSNFDPVPSIKKFGFKTLLFRTGLYYNVSASI